MQKRLATFHNKPIDRTQFDTELLQKQLDLETVNLELMNQDENYRNKFVGGGGQCE